ncbi:MAG: hypothetical protein A2W00_04565 [Candidatus Eisenbacteria bacterium RBG_16_71_46]|nr:MAG: hypothetical protein A2W00_04565 [Candidatus Eisenbacteria bacterium RBG_16_71_46]
MPTATVKIMRSYDYCHFEVQLGSDENLTLEEINDLRKQAALLVDEAVRQYKIAKKKEQARTQHEWETERLLERIQAIERKPERANALFFASARTDIPLLCDALRAAWEQLRTAQDVHREPRPPYGRTRKEDPGP